MTSSASSVSPVREIFAFWTTVANIGTLLAYVLGVCLALSRLIFHTTEEATVSLRYESRTLEIPEPVEYGNKTLAIATVLSCSFCAALDTVLVFLISIKSSRVAPSHYLAVAIVQILLYIGLLSLSSMMLISFVKTYLKWFPREAFKTYNVCLEIGNTLEFSFFTHCTDHSLNIIERSELGRMLGDVCDYLYTFCVESDERLELTILFTAILACWCSLAGSVLIFLIVCYSPSGPSEHHPQPMGHVNEFAIPVRIQRGGDPTTFRSSLAVPVSHFHVAHWPPYSEYPNSARARLSPICVTPGFTPPAATAIQCGPPPPSQPSTAPISTVTHLL